MASKVKSRKLWYENDNAAWWWYMMNIVLFVFVAVEEEYAAWLSISCLHLSALRSVLSVFFGIVSNVESESFCSDQGHSVLMRYGDQLNWKEKEGSQISLQSFARYSIKSIRQNITQRNPKTDDGTDKQATQAASNNKTRQKENWS